MAVTEYDSIFNQMETVTPTQTSGSSYLETANSWLDSLSGTFSKVADIKVAYDNAKTTSSNDSTARAYENIQQQTSLINGVDNKTLIFAGVGVLALAFLVKG